MGKRSDELQAEVIRLRAVNADLRASNLRQREARDKAHEKLTADILREMCEKPFTIVTASGKVIEGRTNAIDVNTATVAWGQFVLAPPRRTATITLHPKHG